MQVALAHSRRASTGLCGRDCFVYLNHNSVILGEKLVNSQFFQRQEAEADDYSYDLLRQRGISPAGLATSFEKLAKLEEGRQSSMFDDHPASAERAQHIRDRMSADGIK